MNKEEVKNEISAIDKRIKELSDERCNLVSRKMSLMSQYADGFMASHGIVKGDRVRIIYKHYETRNSTAIEGFYAGSYFADEPQIQLKRDMKSEIVYSIDCPLIDDIEEVRKIEKIPDGK